MKRIALCLASALLMFAGAAARADDASDTVTLFKNAGESGNFFSHSYGYAVFPNIGKGGFVVGGAYGDGKVFKKGVRVGTASVTQLSVGFQAGGQAYSMIVFFQDERSFNEFTKGEFEFGAGVGAVAITASANAKAGTTGAGAGAAGGKNDATTTGGYHKGVAVFTIVKGGAMYEATVAGMKFKYKPGKT